MNLLPEQILASNPAKNIWLSANAGTGKTYVLVHRFLRLILEGNDPARILCITYTKAAAAEMQKRIIESLSKLIMLSDAELKAKIEKDYNEAFDIKKLGQTKKKLANIIDNPELLKIQTIHSFCQTILKSFPLEVGIPPFFNVIDDNKKAELIDESWNKLMIESNGDAAFNELSARFPTFTIKTLFQNLFDESEKINEVLKNAGGLKNYIELLKTKLTIESESLVDAEMAFYKGIESFLPELASALSQGKATQLGILEDVVTYLRTHKFDDIKIAFLTLEGKPRATIFNKELKEKYPQVFDGVSYWTGRTLDFAKQILNLETFLITKSALVLFTQFANIFETAKKQKYLLDYDDLISKTAELLHKDNINSQWVLYKLDGGIDHILLDEAQDTNTKQWKVIDAITAEFFSGSSEDKNRNRSLFVVGDEKQSIYSFQGADIKIFANKKEGFEVTKSQSISENFETITLDNSFRSCEAILNIVDRVLTHEKVAASVTNSGQIHTHKLTRKNNFGYFEINELVGSSERRKPTKEPIKWEMPKEYISEDERKNKELAAEQVAQRIQQILSRKFPLASSGDLPKPKDIMILLKKRDELANLIIKKLQRLGIPVSGLDRLKIDQNLAIKDLIALGKFMILENDNLNFAALLKSPIFEVSEDELFDICWNRGDKSVFESLKGKATYKETLDKIENIKQKANESAFNFYFYAIEVLGLRNKFIEYFGKQINEILDEFLNVIKTYEMNNNSSIQSFIGWFERSDIEIKRNMDLSEGEVRILTVHGAKGLEAPIVILPDTTSVARTYTPYVFADDMFLCTVQKEYRNDLFNEMAKNEKDDSAREYYRLLYVALTRPRDELYVFGYNNSRKEPDNWHNIIMQAATDICQKHEDRHFYTTNEYLNAAPKAAATTIIKANTLEFKPIEKTQDMEAISPSKLYRNEDEKKIVSVSIDFDKGIATHKLLEILPDINKDQWNTASDVALSNFVDLNEKQKNDIKAETFTVLNNKDFEFIFNSKSKAEVPVCGVLESKFVSGNIDRLVETENEIIIIDYKTNKVSDNNLQSIMTNYKPQLTAYGKLMGNIYKNKKIRTALLFTSINKLVYFD